MRHSNFAAGIALVIVFAGAAQSNFTLPSGQRFVLALANGAELFSQCSRATPQGAKDFWTPTEAQLDELEADLIKELEARRRSDPRRDIAYHRQYVGFVKDGTSLIYGNYYPGADGLFRYERTRAVGVCDGGSAFWGVVYDPATRTFNDFSFNGFT